MDEWGIGRWGRNKWGIGEWGLGSCAFVTAKPSAGEELTLALSLPADKVMTINWGDGNTSTVTGPVTTTNYTHTYTNAGDYSVRFGRDFQHLTYLSKSSSSCTVDGSVSNLSRLTNIEEVTYYGDSTIYGDIRTLPSGLIIFRCYGSNTISGDLANLPSGITYFNCQGNNTILGDIANLPSGLQYFICYGNNTVSGDIANLPSGLKYFACRGNNSISDYSGKTWTTKPGTFTLIPASGGLSTSEVDQLLIDFDADLTWASGNTITLTGTNAARSSASDAAVNNMVAEGATVTTN